MRFIRRPAPFALAALLHAAVLGAVALRAQDAVTAPTSLSKALPVQATGEQIYRAACATCHGLDGKGAPQQVVGFALPLPNGHGFPDFTDCATNTVEPLADWVAVAAARRTASARSIATCRPSAMRSRPSSSSRP